MKVLTCTMVPGSFVGLPWLAPEAHATQADAPLLQRALPLIATLKLTVLAPAHVSCHQTSPGINTADLHRM